MSRAERVAVEINLKSISPLMTASAGQPHLLQSSVVPASCPTSGVGQLLPCQHSSGSLMTSCSPVVGGCLRYAVPQPAGRPTTPAGVQHANHHISVLRVPNLSSCSSEGNTAVSGCFGFTAITNNHLSGSVCISPIYTYITYHALNPCTHLSNQSAILSIGRMFRARTE